MSTYCEQELSSPATLVGCEGPCEGAYWVFSPWSACSKTCGGGQQIREAECQDPRGKILSEEKCVIADKIIAQKCGDGECPLWQHGEWSSCSVSCGPGVRERTYWCEEGGEKISREYCDQDKIPKYSERCNGNSCYVWITEKWTQCSSTCGPGTRNRNVFCVDQTSQEKIIEQRCEANIKPMNNSICIGMMCDNDKNEINTDTEKRIQKMSKSRFRNNNKFNDILSSINKGDQQHKTPRLPRYRWKIGHWSKCSTNCGGGLQTRVVTCYDRVKGQKEPDHRRCSRVRPKPKAEQRCHSENCAEGKWLLGDWSLCSTSCGTVS